MVTDRKAEKSVEKKAKTEALVAELKDRSKRFREDDTAFSTFLRQSAKFHNYSIGNQYLIWFQCPESTAVNSFKRWQELGRQVREGEKAIYIAAPRPYKQAQPDGTEADRVTFRHVPVFDYAQTDPIEGHASPWEPYHFPTLTDEVGGAYVDALIQSLRDEGHEVEEFTEDRHYRGCFFLPSDKNATTANIALNRSMPALQQLNTLVHEIAHMTHWLIDPATIRTIGKPSIEFVGEASSYAVLSEVGFDSSLKSVAYIAAQGEIDSDKEKVALRLVSEVTGRIMVRVMSLQIDNGETQVEDACAA